MDKNTVIGMLLMVAVIFGFMYCQSGNEKKAKNKDNKQTEKVEEKKQASQQNTDSLTVKDFAELKDLVAKNNGAIKYGGMDVSLTPDSTLTGTVKVGNRIVDIKLDSLNSNVNAVSAVRNVISKYGKAEMFIGCLQSQGVTKPIKLKNDSIEIEISSKGGMITRATLKGYKAYHSQDDYKNDNSEPVTLVTPENNTYSFIINDLQQSFDTKDFYFVPENQQGDSTVTMSLVNLPNGAKWSIRYTLVKGTYMVRMEILQQNMDKIMHTNVKNMNFSWEQKIQRQEVGKPFEERNSALYWKLKGDNSVDNLSENGSKKEIVKDKIKWFAAKTQFFSSVLICNKQFNGETVMESKAYEGKDKNYEKYLKEISINTGFDYDYTKSQPVSFYFYFGPNRYNVLKDYSKTFSADGEDLQLTRLVSLGWKLFRWINSGIIMPVFNWLCKTGLPLGIVILILTILLKLVLWPLTVKSYKSQAKMRILQPDIKAINEKYPDQADAMKKQQKIMELYKQAGANPMGGCLPMLLQMPFLIAMFWFFPSSIDLRGQSFLWAPDLSAPDALISLPFSIPLLGNRLSIFCLLMTITNIAYTYVNMQSQKSSMPGMKWMMYLMPIMFLVFFNTYAAGLSYYYFVSLLITIIQTFVTRMLVKEDKVRALMAENAKKPKKKSGFMARLEEAQRRQQQALKEQQKRNNKRR